MIRARTLTSPASFAARLAARAERLAEARTEARLRRRKADGSHWRWPRLLWPLF